MQRVAALHAEGLATHSTMLVIGWIEMRRGGLLELQNELHLALKAYECAWSFIDGTGCSLALSRCLTAIARCSMLLSDLSYAASCLQRGLRSIDEFTHPIWHSDCLAALGEVAWRQGDLASAKEFHRHALTLREQSAPDSLRVAESLHGLGHVLRHQGDLASTETLYLHSLTLRQRLAPVSLLVAESLDSLGSLASQRGQLSSAQDYLQRSLALRERLAPDSLAVAASLNSLGTMAGSHGDLTTAERFLLRALSIQERLIPDSLDLAGSLNSLGLVNLQTGKMDVAESYFSRSLAIRKRLSPESLLVAVNLSNLGVLAKERGKLASAEEYHLQSLTIRERLAPELLLNVAASLTHLGTIAKDRGDLAAAEVYYLRALAIDERLAPASLLVASCLTNLGSLVEAHGELVTAEDYYRRALAIQEEIAPDSFHVAGTLCNLGCVAGRRVDLLAAQIYFERALDIQNRVVPGTMNVAVILFNLGNVASDRGDNASAISYLLQAQAIQEWLAPNSLDLADTLHGLASLYRQQQPLHAVTLHQRALTIVENQRGEIASTEARSLLLAKHLSKYLGLLQSYLALEDTANAFAVLERARARSLVEMLAERQLDFSQDAPASLLQREEELNQRRSQLYADLAGFVTHTSTPEIYQIQLQLQDLERQQQQLTTQIRASSPRYALLQYPQPIDLTTAQAMLDPGTLALVYQTDETQTYLFAITQECCTLHILPIGREALARRVTDFRGSLDIRLLENTLKATASQGHSLYTSLLYPVQRDLRGAQRLLLCLEGPLLMLPFSCLVTNSGSAPRYLGEVLPIHQAISLTVYAQSRHLRQDAYELEPLRSYHQDGEPIDQLAERTGVTPQFQQCLLALGDPLYPDPASTQAASLPPYAHPERIALRSRGMSFTPLPHTRVEIEEIRRLFGQAAMVYLDAEATKTIAKAESTHASIIHFACHAWLDHRFPLSSALVLSQPEVLGDLAPPEDNGLLQAWEVMEQMKLDADLVVLSACKTGLGHEVRGEGLVGLTRAFQYAGASSVLASLWEIHDAATSHFVVEFYRGLIAGESKDVALQRAIRKMRNHPRWHHPYYWGAFILQGDWQTRKAVSTQLSALLTS